MQPERANEVLNDRLLRLAFDHAPDAVSLLESILHNMSDGVIVADKQYRFLVFNPAAERMFGVGASEAQAEGRSRTYGLYLPDQVTEFPADELPLACAIRGESVDDLEMFVRHERAPDGVWITVNARPLRDAGGELAGGVIVCRDITDRKKEDAFRAGQSRVLEMIARGATLSEVLANLVTLIEAQSAGMLCSVVELSEDGKHIRHGAAPSLPEIYVQAVNGAPIGPKNGSCGTAMYLGKQVIVTDMLVDPLWEDYRELAQLSGLRACWSTPIFSGAGKVLGSFAMYYRQPQTPTGTEARLTEVATHIAGIAIEHQRAENELRAREEQLRITQAELAHVARVSTMGELAASIAHEVNQPLGAIVGNADICVRWLNEPEPNLAELREAIEDISSDGHRASQVISRIRSMVKKHVPDKSPLDFNDVAREVVELIGHEAQRKNVRVRTELEDVLPQVAADRIQLQQVLINLVMNAIEAMHEVDVANRELMLRTAQWKGSVLAAVSDRGVGIDGSNAEQIFKPFHTTKSAGMGMGLAISRSIIESHGGRLWAEPIEGGGARFCFTLPAMQQEER
ncbi:MAG TPA: ATP-binding protein [Pyrinomonadaceae bacterium]|nr:ATP-binding protein [Pyrinomonadaceae bacterium]